MFMKSFTVEAAMRCNKISANGNLNQGPLMRAIILNNFFAAMISENFYCNNFLSLLLFYLQPLNVKLRTKIIAKRNLAETILPFA